MHLSSHFYFLTGCLYRPLLEPFESLLQMLLTWDPVARGGTLDTDTNKPHCKTALQNILNMKVNLVLLLTLETIAYIIGLQNFFELFLHPMLTVKDWQ